MDSGGLYGAEKVLLQLMHEQVKMGTYPCLCSIGEKGVPEKPLEKKASDYGFEVIKFRMRNGLNLLGAWSLIQLAQNRNFEVIHSHGYKGDILLGCIPKSLRRIPLVATLHGWTSTEWLSKLAIYEWLDRKSLRFLDAVVLVNKAMISRLNGRFSDLNRLRVIDNGLPLAHNYTVEHLDGDIMDYCSQGFIVGSVGRLSVEKGYTFLLDAIRKLLSIGLNVRLVIIGEGQERGALEKQVTSQNLAGHVLFPGYREDAGDYIPLFDVFVLSSLTEGLPITLLEAMRAGKPVIAPAVGGIPDVLKDGCSGILVPAKNGTALADALQKLYYDQGLRNSLAENAKITFVDKYSSQRMAEEYKGVYESVIDAFGQMA